MMPSNDAKSLEPEPQSPVIAQSRQWADVTSSRWCVRGVMLFFLIQLWAGGIAWAVKIGVPLSTAWRGIVASMLMYGLACLFYRRISITRQFDVLLFHCAIFFALPVPSTSANADQMTMMFVMKASLGFAIIVLYGFIARAMHQRFVLPTKRRAATDRDADPNRPII